MVSIKAIFYYILRRQIKYPFKLAGFWGFGVLGFILLRCNGMFLVCFCYVFDMFLVCFRYVSGMCLVCFWYVFAMFLVCFWYVVDMFLVCFLTYCELISSCSCCTLSFNLLFSSSRHLHQCQRALMSSILKFIDLIALLFLDT